ncbi:MAG: translation initiation factor IF-3 [Elusimicrobia bacterium]|nr:translation initiation factor IF-3 [Elusimicrobiota bacterium]
MGRDYGSRDHRSHGQGQLRLNARIQASQVRLVDSDGTMLGIKHLSEALAMARERKLDLIEIAPQANPPVCKILDYSKFKYEQEKKVRESRKHQKAGLLKEIQLRPNIGAHDLDFKLKHAIEFITNHDKVRITIVFRGREMQHQDIGAKLLEAITEKLIAIAVPEAPPQRERNRMMLTLVPKH